MGGPGVAAKIVRPGDGVEAPEDPSCLGVERRQPSARAELGARHSGVDHALVVARRRGDRVAILPLDLLRPPNGPARALVQGDQAPIELAHEHQAITDGHPPIEPATADARNPLVKMGFVRPQEGAGRRVEGEDIVVAGRDVHDAILDEGCRFLRVLNAQARV